MESIDVTTQKSFNDHDLLLVLHRDVQHITDTLKELKDTDVREIKENTAQRLQKIEDNYTTKVEARQIVEELEKEAIKLLDDHETRIRAIERYVGTGRSGRSPRRRHCLSGLPHRLGHF